MQSSKRHHTKQIQLALVAIVTHHQQYKGINKKFPPPYIETVTRTNNKAEQPRPIKPNERTNGKFVS